MCRIFLTTQFTARSSLLHTCPIESLHPWSLECASPSLTTHFGVCVTLTYYTIWSVRHPHLRVTLTYASPPLTRHPHLRGTLTYASPSLTRHRHLRVTLTYYTLTLLHTCFYHTESFHPWSLECASPSLVLG